MGCNNNALVEFVILRKDLAKSGVRTLTFRKVKFTLFMELLDNIWETVLADKGVEQSWLIFKDAFLSARVLSPLRIRKQAKKAGKLHRLARTCWSNR